MKFGVIIAARLASRRLPGKAMFPLFGLPVLSVVLRRLKTSQEITEIVFATTTNPEDDILAEIAHQENVKVFSGDQDDVLGRYVMAGKSHDSFDYVVRATADCPFIGGETLDPILQQCRELGSFDLVTTKPAYPHGIDYEIYPKRLLEQIDSLPDLSHEDREHILNYIYRNDSTYNIIRLTPPSGLKTDSHLFLLDTPDDFSRIQQMTADSNNLLISAVSLIKKCVHEN